MSETWPDAQPASGTTGWRIRCACAAALCLLGALPDALERQWLRLEPAAHAGSPHSSGVRAVIPGPEVARQPSPLKFPRFQAPTSGHKPVVVGDNETDAGSMQAQSIR